MGIPSSCVRRIELFLHLSCSPHWAWWVKVSCVHTDTGSRGHRDTGTRGSLVGGSSEGTPRGGIEGMGRQTGEATRLTVTRQTSSRDHGQPFLSITGKMSLNLAFIEEGADTTYKLHISD